MESSEEVNPEKESDAEPQTADATRRTSQSQHLQHPRTTPNLREKQGSRILYFQTPRPW